MEIIAAVAARAAPTAASAVPSGSMSARSSVFFTEFAGDYYSETLRQRPGTIHGGSDCGWCAIRWRYWGGALAYGTGRAYHVNKDQVPYRQTAWRAAFRMGRRARCYGRLVYREMLVVNGLARDPYLPRRWRFPYPCGNATQ